MPEGPGLDLHPLVPEHPFLHGDKLSNRLDDGIDGVDGRSRFLVTEIFTILT